MKHAKAHITQRKKCKKKKYSSCIIHKSIANTKYSPTTAPTPPTSAPTQPTLFFLSCVLLFKKKDKKIRTKVLRNFAIFFFLRDTKQKMKSFFFESKGKKTHGFRFRVFCHFSFVNKINKKQKKQHQLMLSVNRRRALFCLFVCFLRACFIFAQKTHN